MEYLCIGLGNPGRRYEPTRHNVGFWLVDLLARRHGVALSKAFLRPWRAGSVSLPNGVRLTLVKPLTYMNRTGETVRRNPDFRPDANRTVLVFCDQMDLPAGTVRLKRQGGTAGHNGLKSLAAEIGTDFRPVYIGIGRPVAGGEVVSHVLGVPDDADRELITAGLEKAADGVELIIRQGFEPAMAFINRNDAPRSRP